MNLPRLIAIGWLSLAYLSTCTPASAFSGFGIKSPTIVVAIQTLNLKKSVRPRKPPDDDSSTPSSTAAPAPQTERATMPPPPPPPSAPAK
jgi:hypothetical protein